MNRIGIFVNETKPKAKEVASELHMLIENKGGKAFLEENMAKVLGLHEKGLSLSQFAEKVDLVFVIGGDGTLLGIARELAAYSLPILGFNVGNMGFLSEAEPDDLSGAVDRVLAGNYCIEKRFMLHTEVIRAGNVMKSGIALNDVGIAKGSFSRMITCNVQMDGRLIGTYSGDGVIVSTPTGSTAYSLSCGGPLVFPGIQALLLTPICPHTLTARPMVLPPESVLDIHVSARHCELEATLDGQVGFCLQSGDLVRVKRANHHTLLVKWKERSFFDVVRKKLQASEQEASDESAKTY
ncbi:NAD(+)/NADH kinase [Hazenella sp. IB182357]|uniref:NAD kinase n=1 Tax=Polycladospora coralii TaxID=2771432 RepID=A0A926RV73_9BACL|nr:NAD(+)/NADH kinase [Polycladospora coralii]MBD1373259.1 NAD(+)/NADH kinase [Polycladospora coralii]MBS7530917.1 NAD(+)/NADH kinase [Polycladospora coralii]